MGMTEAMDKLIPKACWQNPHIYIYTHRDIDDIDIFMLCLFVRIQIIQGTNMSRGPHCKVGVSHDSDHNMYNCGTLTHSHCNLAQLL